MGLKVSVRENLLENIKTTLEGITKANGYDYDIASVQRWKQHGNDFISQPVIIICAGNEEKEATPSSLVTCNLKVYLDVYVRQEEDATEPTDTLLNEILRDIEVALSADYTRGGYAHETRVTNIFPFVTSEEAPHAGFTIEVTVLYQHDYGDPEQQR